LGCAINKPIMGGIASDYTIQLTHAEENYNAAMYEIGVYAGKFVCFGSDFSFVGWCWSWW